MVERSAARNCVITVQIDMYSRMIDHAKISSNQNRVHELYMRIAILWRRRDSRENEEQVQFLIVDIRVSHIKVKETYDNTWGKVFTIGSGVISIFAGAAGLAPLTGTRFFSAATAETLGKASNGLGAAGNGVGGFTKLFDEKEAGNRTLAQASVDENKRVQDQHETTRRQHNQQEREAIGSLKSAYDAEGSTVRAILSN